MTDAKAEKPGTEEANGAAAEILIKEGGAVIECQGAANAFYNPAQEFNRDLR